MNENNKIDFCATFTFDGEHNTDIYFSNKWEAAREMVALFTECEQEQGKLICINFHYKPRFSSVDAWNFNLDEDIKISESFEVWEWALHAKKMLDLKFSDLEEHLEDEGFEW